MYLRHRTHIKISNKLTTPKEAFIGLKPLVNHLRVWGCKVYTYINLKSLLEDSRKDKLMDRGKVGVFIGYLELLDKQYHI